MDGYVQHSLHGFPPLFHSTEHVVLLFAAVPTLINGDPLQEILQAAHAHYRAAEHSEVQYKQKVSCSVDQYMF